MGKLATLIGVVVLGIVIEASGNLASTWLQSNLGLIGQALAWEWTPLVVTVLFALTWATYWYVIVPRQQLSATGAAPEQSITIYASASTLNINGSHATVVNQSSLDAPQENPKAPPPTPQPGGKVNPADMEYGTYVIQQPDGSMLIPKVIRKMTFRITEIPLGANVIVGQEFEDCEIHGPALMYPDGTNAFEECYFEAVKTLDSILWEVEPGQLVVGPVKLTDCTFRRCTFRGIGIVGIRATLDALKASLTP